MLELIRTRSLQGLSTHVLDLYGGGYFLNEHTLAVDSMTGFRLKNIDQARLRVLKKHLEFLFKKKSDATTIMSCIEDIQALEAMQSFPNRVVVEGNMYHFKAIRQLRARLASLQIAGFDVTICRPLGPFYSFALNPDAATSNPQAFIPFNKYFLAQLQRVYSITSRQNGIMFLQLPDLEYSEQHIAMFTDILNTVPGIVFNYVHHTDSVTAQHSIMIQKTAICPSSLLPFFESNLD